MLGIRNRKSFKPSPGGEHLKTFFLYNARNYNPPRRFPALLFLLPTGNPARKQKQRFCLKGKRDRLLLFPQPPLSVGRREKRLLKRHPFRCNIGEGDHNCDHVYIIFGSHTFFKSLQNIFRIVRIAGQHQFLFEFTQSEFHIQHFPILYGVRPHFCDGALSCLGVFSTAKTAVQHLTGCNKIPLCLNPQICR